MRVVWLLFCFVLFFFCFFFGVCVGALVLGRLSDRVGNIAVLVGTSLIYLIALVLLAVVFLFTQCDSYQDTHLRTTKTYAHTPHIQNTS